MSRSAPKRKRGKTMTAPGRKAPPKESERRTLEQRLRSMTLTQFVLAAAGFLVALGTIMNGTGAVLDYTYRAWVSGPMPYAARIEVEEARKLSAKDLADLASATAKQNAQTTTQITNLTSRTEESAQRGARVASVLQNLQLTALRTKLAEAKADSEAHPDSDAARKLVLAYQQELDEIEKVEGVMP